MPEILFNAFSFLQKKLKSKGFSYSNVNMNLPEGYTVNDLLKHFCLTDPEVEAVMVNGKVGSFDHVLKNGDRIAFLPPGTPGPHRFLLGIRRVT